MKERTERVDGMGRQRARKMKMDREIQSESTGALREKIKMKGEFIF